MFHMPAFIFVSGYLSSVKSPFPWKNIIQLSVSYFIINTMMMFYSYFIMDNSLRLLKPYYSCWYMLSLIIWRITLPHLSKIRHIFLLSVILSLAVGFSTEIDNTFTLARTIAFYPFFIGGYLLKMGKKDLVNKKIPFLYKLTGCGILVFITYLICYKLNSFHVTTNQEMMQAYKTPIYDCTIRMCILIIASMMIIGLILIIPHKKIPFITRWGANSLTIYLFHRIFPLLFATYLPLENYHLYYIAISAVISILTLFILGSSAIANRYEDLVSNITNLIMIDDKNHPDYTKKMLLFIVLILFIALLFIEQKTGLLRELLQ